MAKPSKPKSSSLLLTVSVLLVGAAIVRGTLGASQAIAALPPGTEQAVNDPQECSVTETPSALALALLERERDVTSREENLQNRMQMMADAEQSIKERMDEMRAVQAGLEETIAMAEQASEHDISQLVAVYEAMKPEQAAGLFSEMPPSFAAGFLGRMSATSAAGIMAGMDPNGAYAISAYLAGRNANVPTE